MKNPLKRFTIAITGDFGKARSLDKLKQWIETNGGVFATKVGSEVTHLICSTEHYKKSVAMVRQARSLKKIKIVSYDWLEDSLLNHSPKREGDYLLNRQVKTKAKSKAKKKAIRKENIRKGAKVFKKGCEEFRQIMHAGVDIPIRVRNGYHVYRDDTGFSYDVTLARADLTTNQNERYSLKVGIPLSTPVFPAFSPRSPRVPLDRPRTQRLQLYETHIAPFTYACYVIYSSASSGTASHILAPLASSFEVAMSSFKGFFGVKTKKEWDERLVHKEVNDERAFSYTPPSSGKPQGRV